MSDIKLSVIMPLYNAEKYVHKAIDCILNQTFGDFELLLIDDCGTDSTMEIVKQIQDSRIRILHNDKNRGIAYSRNVGLQNARGEFIALMDDDDLTTLDRFERQVSYLDTHREIDAVGGRTVLIDEYDNVCKELSMALENPCFVKATLMFMNPLGNGSMMFRSRIVEDYGIRFRDDCLGMEDYLFWVEFSQYGAITNLKDVVLYWRCVRGNESFRVMEEKRDARKEKFFEIRKRAMEIHGFELSDADWLVLKNMFPEGGGSIRPTKKEIAELYDVLKKLIYQAEYMSLENAEEVKIACRKQFSKRIEFSQLW